MRMTDCANVKGMFRIIRFPPPPPKAEPFKQWPVQVCYDCVPEIENPELAQERRKELYEQKGYPKDWIDRQFMPGKLEKRREMRLTFAETGCIVFAL